MRLNDIKFQGKPPKIVPLRYSVMEIINEKIKNRDKIEIVHFIGGG